MRVLAMLHAYVPQHGAGGEGMAHALLRDLVAHGHQVDVILSAVDADAVDDYEIDGVSVHVHRGKTQTPNWLNSPMKPHVIVCHLENTSRAAVLGKMYDIPVVQILHNDMAETLASTLHHTFALLVCNTHWLRQQYEWNWEQYGSTNRPMPRMITVHPPVDPAEYATKPGTHVTLVNMFAPKGAHVFYQVAERLPNYKFLAVQGAYGLQVLRHDLPNVTIIDHVPSTQMRESVYGRTRIVLMPSDYESYGRVAIEAMCSGIPVIANPTTGLRESLGEAGIFADRNDIDAWVAEIRRLHSPKAWGIASRAALARVKELDPAGELATWRTAMEEVARVPALAG